VILHLFEGTSLMKEAAEDIKEKNLLVKKNTPAKKKLRKEVEQSEIGSFSEMLDEGQKKQEEEKE